jgi:transposase
MDVESYFTVDGNDWQQQSYCESESEDHPATEDVKFIISVKVLLWLAVYQYFINLSKNTSITKKIVFWSVLASAHYAKDTLVRLAELKVLHFPKEVNPPNVPQIRPIEFFLANLKRKVYSNNYRPKDVKCLMAKIRKELIETTGIRKAMKELPHSCNYTCKIAALITGNSVLCFHNKKCTNNQ